MRPRLRVSLYEGLSVRMSVCPSVRMSISIQAKPPKTRISACEMHRISDVMVVVVGVVVAVVVVVVVAVVVVVVVVVVVDVVVVPLHILRNIAHLISHYMQTKYQGRE